VRRKRVSEDEAAREKAAREDYDLSAEASVSFGPRLTKAEVQRNKATLRNWHAFVVLDKSSSILSLVRAHWQRPSRDPEHVANEVTTQVVRFFEACCDRTKVESKTKGRITQQSRVTLRNGNGKVIKPPPLPKALPTGFQPFVRERVVALLNDQASALDFDARQTRFPVNGARGSKSGAEVTEQLRRAVVALLTATAAKLFGLSEKEFDRTVGETTRARYRRHLDTKTRGVIRSLREKKSSGGT